ncbi:Uncharacterised protein [Mycoplasmopsis californica]|uniref:Lipoprotein 17-related variable surface protein n=1 Tax=Mycoplasmopsis equigenitalium TaxID=114883 RepID=A0ABY5J1R7_9BACT|nr:lipoprotein 17-related variable surface protein [Mycoplasmopsis equigenitalium]UUD37190.1 lipoprotein 17-related variable surface protein [Mycoplasmopsis equigenitalium]VEU69505.1 Uncharacterised protein [Mycoplasmopsis californica]
MNQKPNNIPSVAEQQPQQPTQYFQQPTQIVPLHQPPLSPQPAPRSSLTKKIVSSVIAIGIPVVITAAIVGGFLGASKKKEQSDPKLANQMSSSLNGLNVEIEDKQDKYLLDINDSDLKLKGIVPKDCSAHCNITELDYKNNTMLVSVRIVTKEGRVFEKEISIGGFKEIKYDDANVMAALSAVTSLRNNIKATKNKNTDKKIITANHKNTVVNDLVYNNSTELENDTQLPITKIEADNNVVIEIIQRPHYNPVTKEVDQLQIIATISSGSVKSQVIFYIDGFMSQTKMDLQTLDSIFSSLGKSYTTIHYDTKTNEQVSQNEYLDLNKIFADINFDIASVKTANPELSFEAPQFKISGDTALEVSINAKLGNATKALVFEVSGFSSLKQYNRTELNEFAKKFISPVATRYYTNRLPKAYTYRDYLDLFSDLDWHFEAEAQTRNITIDLKSQQNNDDAGEKIVEIILGKNQAEVKVLLRVTGFKTLTQFAEDNFNTFFEQIPSPLFTTKHTKQQPKDVDYNLNELESDTHFNFTNVAKDYGLTISIKAQNNSGTFAENGFKQVTLEVQLGSLTKTKDIVVEGFLTKGEANKIDFPKILAAIGNAPQTTKKYTNRGASEPDSQYNTFDDFANDVQINFASLKSRYPDLKFESFHTLNNEDGFRTVSFTVRLGKEHSVRTIRINGFLNDAVAVEENVKRIRNAINDTYVTTKHTKQLPATTLYSKNLAKYDADLGTTLSTLGQTYHATISAKNETTDQNNGLMIITLNINYNGKDYEERFTITGFWTRDIYINKVLDSVIAKLNSTYATTTHTKKIPSKVKYANAADLCADLGIDYAGITRNNGNNDITIEIDNTKPEVNDDTNGTKQIYLNIAKDGHVRSHRILITGFSNEEQLHNKVVDDFVNGLTKEYTTTLYKNTHNTQVLYQTKADIKNDIGLDLSQKESELGLLIDFSKGTIGEGFIEFNLNVKSAAKPTISRSATITIQGFLATNIFERNVLNEYIANFTSNFTTLKYTQTYVKNVKYNTLNEIYNDGAKGLEVKAEETSTKYQNNDNNRQITLELNNGIADIDDIDAATKVIHLKARYGNEVKEFTITFAGYLSQAKFEEKVLDEYLSIFRNTQFTTINNKNNLPASVKYNNINAIFNDGANTLKTKAHEITEKYKANNARQISLALDNTKTDIDDKNSGTKNIHLRVSYGQSTKDFSITFTGYSNAATHNTLLKKQLNDFINNELKAMLKNNGNPVDDRYMQNLPSAVRNEDIIFGKKNGSAIESWFNVSLSNIVRDDHTLQISVDLNVTISKDGDSATQKVTQIIKTGDPQKVVNDFFENSNFGYVKLTRGYDVRGDYETKMNLFEVAIPRHTDFINLKDNLEANDLSINYITSTWKPNTMNISFDIAKVEYKTDTTYTAYEMENTIVTEPGMAGDMIYLLDKINYGAYRGVLSEIQNNKLIPYYYNGDISSSLEHVGVAYATDFEPGNTSGGELKTRYKSYSSTSDQALYGACHGVRLGRFAVENNPIPGLDHDGMADVFYQAQINVKGKGYIHDEPTLWINVTFDFLGKKYYKSIRSSTPVVDLDTNIGVFTKQNNKFYINYYFDISKENAIAREDGKK